MAVGANAGSGVGTAAKVAVGTGVDVAVGLGRGVMVGAGEKVGVGRAGIAVGSNWHADNTNNARIAKANIDGCQRNMTRYYQNLIVIPIFAG